MSRGRISRNTAINMVGAILPLLLTLFTIPRYLRLIGDVRFGVLAMVWLLLSYFAIFDMGLGRATSRSIAQLKTADDHERASVFWTALLINSTFGIVGGFVLWVVAREFLGVWLNIPAALRPELFSALPWLAAAVPVATNLSVMVGALEGRERFLAVNSLQVFSAATFQLVSARRRVLAWAKPEVACGRRRAGATDLKSAAVLRVPKSGPPYRNAPAELAQEPRTIFLRQLDHRVGFAYAFNGDPGSPAGGRDAWSPGGHVLHRTLQLRDEILDGAGEPVASPVPTLFPTD